MTKGDKKEQEIIHSEQNILNLREAIRINTQRYDDIRYRYEKDYVNERMSLREEIEKQNEKLALLKARHCELLKNL